MTYERGLEKLDNQLFKYHSSNSGWCTQAWYKSKGHSRWRCDASSTELAVSTFWARQIWAPILYIALSMGITCSASTLLLCFDYRGYSVLTGHLNWICHCTSQNQGVVSAGCSNSWSSANNLHKMNDQKVSREKVKQSCIDSYQQTFFQGKLFCHLNWIIAGNLKTKIQHCQIQHPQSTICEQFS